MLSVHQQSCGNFWTTSCRWTTQFKLHLASTVYHSLPKQYLTCCNPSKRLYHYPFLDLITAIVKFQPLSFYLYHQYSSLRSPSHRDWLTAMCFSQRAMVQPKKWTGARVQSVIHESLTRAKRVGSSSCCWIGIRTESNLHTRHSSPICGEASWTHRCKKRQLHLHHHLAYPRLSSTTNLQ